MMMRHLTTLYPAAPYRFDLLLDFLGRFAHPTLDVVQDGAYWRALRAGDGLALLRVTEVGRADAPALAVHLAAATGAVDEALALAELKRVLPLHDRRDFYGYAAGEADLWAVVEPLRGLPELRSASLFEALAQAVIEQQIAWVAAQKAQRWLVEWAGNMIEYGGRAYYAFPTPAQVAGAMVEDLKPTKITFKRMALLIEVAAGTAEGRLALEAMRGMAAEAAYRQLLTIKGVGHWTAVVALERACGHRQWVAHNDVVLQAATNRYFLGGTGRIPPEQVTATFARFGVYGGLAAHYTMLRWVFEKYPAASDLTP